MRLSNHYRSHCIGSAGDVQQTSRCCAWIDYNPDHRDHLHIDISRAVRFRETNSVTSFLQQALNTFYRQTLEVDGEYGDSTEKALNDTLAVLDIPNVNSIDNWQRFMDTVCDEGVTRVAAALDAEIVALAPSREAQMVTDVAPAMADIKANPWLPIAEEPSVETPNLLAIRPETSRIDLGYKPFPTWTISSRMVGNKEQWFVDFDGASRFYVGYRFTFQGTYVGLARTGSSGATQVPYDHETYRPMFGEWASFIHPTARCESEGQFLVVNSWDAAAMTLASFRWRPILVSTWRISSAT